MKKEVLLLIPVISFEHHSSNPENRNSPESDHSGSAYFAEENPARQVFSFSGIFFPAIL